MFAVCCCRSSDCQPGGLRRVVQKKCRVWFNRCFWPLPSLLEPRADETRRLVSARRSACIYCSSEYYVCLPVQRHEPPHQVQQPCQSQCNEAMNLHRKDVEPCASHSSWWVHVVTADQKSAANPYHHLAKSCPDRRRRIEVEQAVVCLRKPCFLPRARQDLFV